MNIGLKPLLLNTVQKEVRSKTLYILFGFTVLLIIMVNLFVNFLYTNLLDENTSQIVGDKTVTIVYMVIDFWSTFLCILFGVNTIRSDISSGTIGQLLSFPMKRSSYILARILGSGMMVFAYYVASLILAIIVFSFSTQKLVGGMEMVYAFAPSILSIFILMLLSVNLSLFMPRMIAFITTSFLTFFIVLSNKAFMGKELANYFEELTAVKSIALVFHMLFPRIGVMSSWTSSLLFSSELEFNMLSEGIHFVISFGLWTLVTIKLFDKEDM